MMTDGKARYLCNAVPVGDRCSGHHHGAVCCVVHDLGRVGIGRRIRQKPGSLNADQWEQVRLHPYHTERVLSRLSFLSAPAPVVGADHEGLDGGGYQRAAYGAELSLERSRRLFEPHPRRARRLRMAPRGHLRLNKR